MSRSTPAIADVVARLMAVRLIIRGLDRAIPTLAAEMRREACESIEDIIKDLAPFERGAPR